jgi:hypothetical protein
MHDYIHRLLTKEIEVSLEHYPVTALLGPRQCGKSTLSKRILEKIDDTNYLDLELPSDLGKMSDPELFLRAKTTSLVCIDEIQRLPDLFPVLRALVDESQRKRRFLILGSASPDLIRQSSETLAGRINYLELTPLRLAELANTDPNTLWIRGGFPDSYLASVDDLSLGWRENFIRTFLERDLAQMDVRLPATTMRRFWVMLAHLHGQTINYSKLGQSLDLSHTTIKRWLDVLEQTFMIRTLPPMESNLKKRLVKSPKVYIRDSGLLHALLEIETFDHLMGHPIVGASWEGFCVETLVSSFTKGRFSFFRTTSGQEVDCIYERKDKRIGFEIKLSSAPKIARGTYSCVGDLNLTHLFVISPVGEAYPLSKDITVADVLTVVDRVERLL